MSRQQRIEQILKTLAPVTLIVQNDSAAHQGHGGHDKSGETHYTVTMVASVFEGRGRVERQRLVMSLLEEEFKSGLHALSLQLRAPGEHD